MFKHGRSFISSMPAGSAMLGFGPFDAFDLIYSLDSGVLFELLDLLRPLETGRAPRSAILTGSALFVVVIRFVNMRCRLVPLSVFHFHDAGPVLNLDLHDMAVNDRFDLCFTESGYPF